MPTAGSLNEMRAAGSLSEIMTTVGSLREITLDMQPLPVKIRSVEPKAGKPASPDLPVEEKSSFDLAAASYGPSQTKEVPKPSWDTNHVMVWRDADLPTPVYVRVDKSKAFHTYPSLDGPFRSLDEIERAVDFHARVKHALGSRTGTSKELSYKDRVIHENLYWPDGSRKVSTMLQISEREAEDVQRLVKALLDKRNNDKNLEDELKGIVHWQSVCEGPRDWYYHLNITVKTAADDVGSASLFFAEVTLDQNDTPGYYLSSFERVNNDGKDEVPCHGCINNGSTDMKHPAADSYNGGHMNIGFPMGFGPSNDKQWREPHNKEDDDKLIEEEEDRIRASFDYLDDKDYLEELRSRRRANFSKAT